MGKRGPKPLPTTIHILNGNPGKRPLNDQEPDFDPADLRPPTGITKMARKKWRQMAPMLLERGLLTQGDRDMLHNYCLAFERWQQAEKVLSEEGTTFESVSEDGFVRISQRPEVNISKTYQQQMYRIAAEFGMSPSSRSRVKATPPKTKKYKDPMDELLSA
jgi:P27 family predicted phage terminase small subunit